MRQDTTIWIAKQTTIKHRCNILIQQTWLEFTLASSSQKQAFRQLIRLSVVSHTLIPARSLTS